MTKWEEKRLGEYIQINPENIQPAKFTGKINYIDISSVNRGILEKYTEYEFENAPSRARRIIKAKDVIYAMVRPNLRAYYYVKKCPKNAICSTGFAVLRAKENMDSRFLYYITTENSFVDYLALVAKGASYPAVDAKDFLSAKITIPDLSTQQRIADILSAYDDLIENNNRRIAILEKSAQELYKEWFVRLRFPNYEKTKFVNGLPEGWEIKRLHNCGKIETGKTPPTQNTKNYGKDIMFIKTPDMHGKTFVLQSEEMLSYQGHAVQPKKLLPPNSILVNCIGAGAGVAVINGEQAHTNQQINSIVLKNEYCLEWLYFTCKTLRPMIRLIGSTGTTMINLSKGKFENLKIIFPKKDLVDKFHTITNPLFKKIKKLQQQNTNLAKQRDLLLPRLLSGKLEV